MKSLIVKLEDLSIASKYEGAPSQGSYGGPWSDPNQFLHIQIPNELDPDCVKVELINGVNTVTADSTLAANKLAGQWDQLRAERNKRLSECDYTQIPDAVTTQAKEDEYIAYRTLLRDLPANTGNPASPTWPTKPA